MHRKLRIVLAVFSAIAELGFAQGTLDCSKAVQLACGQTINDNTQGAPSNVKTYTGVNWNESGPEDVFTIQVNKLSRLIVTLSNLSGNPPVNLDVFILESCDVTKVLAFGDRKAIYANAAPAKYYIVVEGRDNAAGSYSLTVQCETGFPQTDSILWSESFEDNPDKDWNSDYGVWEMGVVTSGPNNAFVGRQCAATKVAGDYPDNVNTRLIRFTTFVVPDVSLNPRLRFWSWHSFNCGDYGKVQIKVQGSDIWEDLPDATFSSHSSGVWSYRAIGLFKYAGKTVQIAFFLHSEDCWPGGWETGPGWYIDNVAVVTGSEVVNFPEQWEQMGIKDWNANHGTWEVGVPTSGPNNAYSQPFCLASVLDGAYGDNTDSWFTSPPFKIPPANTQPSLRFRHWYSFNCGDWGKVKIYFKNAWVDIDTYSGTSSGWAYPRHDLSTYADSTVILGFVMHSEDCWPGGWDIDAGWYIDDIEITGSPLPCTYSISPTSRSFPAGGGADSVNVTTAIGCSWTATSNTDWIHIISGNNGSGNGTVNYSVDLNSGLNSRTGTMNIAGQSFTITQTACVFTISPESQAFDANGGVDSITVSAESGCTWTATKDSSWIMITGGANGSGNGTVTYSVMPNLFPLDRKGTIKIADKEFTVNQSRKATGIPISPIVTSPQFATQEFWADIKVGDATNPVANLFGVSFCLTFTNTEFVDVVTPYANTVLPGDFLGSDFIFQSNVDESAGKICIGMTRKAGQGGTNGSGILARIKFVTKPNTPDKVEIQFCVTEVVANDPNGGAISLTPACAAATINKCMAVWPGDTNNNGKVDQVDVLPIGLYWGRTGLSCSPSPSCAWSARCCTPWSPAAATYADANGDGKVDQADVLCIGLNWNKTHATSQLFAVGTPPTQTSSVASASLAPEVNSVQRPNQEFVVRLKADGVIDLFGLSFELLYDHANYISIISIEPDSLFGGDVVFYSNVDTAAGKIAVGISRKAGQKGVTGAGSAVRVKAIVANNTPNGTTIQFSLQSVVANDSNGEFLQLSPGSSRTTIFVPTIVADYIESIPVNYRLEQNYPNPFNPTTRIEFALPRLSHVTLRIFNLNGQEVVTLVSGELSAGQYQVDWDASSLNAGTYFYQLKTEEFAQTRKLTLVK